MSFENSNRKSIDCLAAVAWAPKQPLSLETITVGPPKMGEVRIRIIATGVCQTDTFILEGKHKNKPFPCILGHEGAGIVESVGEGVTSLKTGDHVIPLFMAECGECQLCKSDRTNACEKIQEKQGKGLMPDGTSRFTCKGQNIFHFMGTSTFTQYTVCTEISVAKINDKAPLDKVCLLGCGISSGFGAALNIAQVKKGSTCAIWGLGTVGLSVAYGCQVKGARTIIGIDINEDKFCLATKFGCTQFINPKEHRRPLQEVLIEMTDGGLDYTFECIGSVETMRAAFESSHKHWGTSVIIGSATKEQDISVKYTQLMSGRTWKGTIFGGWKGRTDVPKLVEQYLNKQLIIDEFITHTTKLSQIGEAFDLLKSGHSVKTVIYLE